MYVLQIRASLCYKLGKLCFIANQEKRCCKLGQLHYYKLGQVRTAVKHRGKIYYKLGQVLEIRAIITNWGITTNS